MRIYITLFLLKKKGFPMANFPIRTDLALEAREFIEEAKGEMRGIIHRLFNAR